MWWIYNELKSIPIDILTMNTLMNSDIDISVDQYE